MKSVPMPQCYRSLTRFSAHRRFLEVIIQSFSFSFSFLLVSAVIDIDSVGTFTMCHEALKYLKKGGPGKDISNGGTIINISATLHYTASWYQIHVSAAKVCKLRFSTFLIILLMIPIQYPYILFFFYQAAVDSITRSLALEWGTDYNIRVNGIAPGPIEDTAGASKLGPKEMMSSRQHMPLFKLGEKWDIAMAALYLASDAGQ